MPLLTIPVPPLWAKAADVGVRYFLLSVVLWGVSRFVLRSTTTSANQMLVMAAASVAVVFLYYLVVKQFILDFPVDDAALV